ncbi:MAG TPA: hypothetical protein VE178_08500 [Silvibacterium sp.]|nr:hypothetical protein [Silvibacterium sp.]
MTGIMPLAEQVAEMFATVDVQLSTGWTICSLIVRRMAVAKFSWLDDHGRVTIALAIPMATLSS